MDNIVDKLITVGFGLTILGGAWLIWFISGVANNLFSSKQWSWTRMLEDVTKTLVMALAVLAWVVLAEALDWYTTQVGMDISELLDGASVTGLIGIICGGSGYYVMKAFRNFASFIGETHVAKQVGEADYKAVAEPVKEFLETITSKTSQEDIEAAVTDADDPVLDYEEVDTEEAGKGGLNNTYPDTPKRYRTAAQDTITDPSTCWNRECVSYCAWKIAEATGKWLTRTGGMSAKYWVQRLAENGYTKVVSAPQNGGKYVGISTAGQYGHVLWFEEGNTISEYNYLSAGNFSVRNINLSAYIWVEIKAPASTNTESVQVAKKSNAEIADEVIAMKWGVQPERQKKLEAAGYNYNDIRAIVNAKLDAGKAPTAAPKSSRIEVGSVVYPTRLVDYTGHSVRQYDQSYTVTQLQGNRAVLSARGQVWCAMNVKDLRLA